MGFLPDKSERPPGSRWPAIFIGVFASIGGVLFGYDTASISGILTMPYWIEAMATNTDENGEPFVTTTQTSLVVSLLSVGTFIGALLAGPTGDWLGRRWGLVVSNCIFIVGVVLQTIAHSLPLFIAGRVVAGLGVGLVSALGMLLVECELINRSANFLRSSSPLSIRVCSQVDSRHHRRLLPTLHCSFKPD